MLQALSFAIAARCVQCRFASHRLTNFLSPPFRFGRLPQHPYSCATVERLQSVGRLRLSFTRRTQSQIAQQSPHQFLAAIGIVQQPVNRHVRVELQQGLLKKPVGQFRQLSSLEGRVSQ